MLKFNPLPGTDLVTYLAEKAEYSEQMVADITLQILDALNYIEWRGRVYLNLEPVNVLVSSGRSLGKTVQVKLANFETTQTVAKTGTQIKGTYNFDYAAPEIIEEAQAFPQSDVWSLGVLLYVLMSGQLPFKGETPEEVGAHRWTNPADYMLKKRERARFPTNRIQKFSKDYHKSRPCMDMDSQSFMARLLQ